MDRHSGWNVLVRQKTLDSITGVPVNITKILAILYIVFKSINRSTGDPLKDRLVGLVVKASASRAEDPGFEFRLRRDFFKVESYQ